LVNRPPSFLFLSTLLFQILKLDTSWMDRVLDVVRGVINFPFLSWLLGGAGFPTKSRRLKSSSAQRHLKKASSNLGMSRIIL